MSFAFFMQEVNGLAQVVLENKTDDTMVIILPAAGAALHAFNIKMANGPFNLIDHYEDSTQWQNESGLSFKSSKLSPFACKTAKGRYSFAGKQYEFRDKRADGSVIHGLLFNKIFKVVDTFCDDNQASVQLKYVYNRDDPGFPFMYRCEISYTLFSENLLCLQTTIINLDDNTMPLADGWHPYFRLGGKIDQWRMRIDAESILELDGDGIPTNRIIPFSNFKEEQTINEIKLDHCFILKNGNEAAACTLYNPSSGLSVSVFPDDSYPYLVVYTSPDRESIAVENLSAPPDHLNNNMGTILLAPRHHKTFTVYYKIIKE